MPPTVPEVKARGRVEESGRRVVGGLPADGLAEAWPDFFFR